MYHTMLTILTSLQYSPSTPKGLIKSPNNPFDKSPSTPTPRRSMFEYVCYLPLHNNHLMIRQSGVWLEPKLKESLPIKEKETDVYVCYISSLYLMPTYTTSTFVWYPAQWLHPRLRRRLDVLERLKRRMTKMCTFLYVLLCICITNKPLIQGNGYTQVQEEGWPSQESWRGEWGRCVRSHLFNSVTRSLILWVFGRDMATPKSKKKASRSMKIEEEDKQDVYVITCHSFCDYC